MNILLEIAFRSQSIHKEVREYRLEDKVEKVIDDKIDGKGNGKSLHEEIEMTLANIRKIQEKLDSGLTPDETALVKRKMAKEEDRLRQVSLDLKSNNHKS